MAKATASKTTKKTTKKTAPAEPTLRSAQHQAALDEYEKGVRLLQQKDYSKAIPRFETVIEKYPNEAVLCDRSRTYLQIAQRGSNERSPLTSTRDADKSFEVGVYLLNEGQFKEAVRHLERAVEHSPENDGVHVALASALLQSGDKDACLRSLEKALELDQGARFRVKSMSDFEQLAADAAFQQLVMRD